MTVSVLADSSISLVLSTDKTNKIVKATFSPENDYSVDIKINKFSLNEVVKISASGLKRKYFRRSYDASTKTLTVELQYPFRIDIDFDQATVAEICLRVENEPLDELEQDFEILILSKRIDLASQLISDPRFKNRTDLKNLFLKAVARLIQSSKDHKKLSALNKQLTKSKREKILLQKIELVESLFSSLEHKDYQRLLDLIKKTPALESYIKYLGNDETLSNNAVLDHYLSNI